MTPMARATPPIAHPAFPVICGIPPELVLLAPVADDVLEPDRLVVLVPDGLAVLEPDGLVVLELDVLAVLELDIAEVCVAVVLDFDAVPLEVVIETALVLPVIEPVDYVAALVVETGRLSVRITALN
jgi:hypothetical protein